MRLVEPICATWHGESGRHSSDKTAPDRIKDPKCKMPVKTLRFWKAKRRPEHLLITF